MRRGDVLQALADVFYFGKIVASALGGSGSVELRVSTSDDDPAPDAQEWWGTTPGVLCRPPAGAEACGLDLGSERIVLGVKERRWQVAVEEGECVVRALGAGDAAYIKLKPDGTVEVHATAIQLSGDDAAAARADRTDAALRKLQLAFDNHVHATAGTGAPSPPILPAPLPGTTVPVGTLASSAADKVRLS